MVNHIVSSESPGNNPIIAKYIFLISFFLLLLLLSPEADSKDKEQQ